MMLGNYDLPICLVVFIFISNILHQFLCFVVILLAVALFVLGEIFNCSSSLI